MIRIPERKESSFTIAFSTNKRLWAVLFYFLQPYSFHEGHVGGQDLSRNEQLKRKNSRTCLW